MSLGSSKGRTKRVDIKACDCVDHRLVERDIRRLQERFLHVMANILLATDTLLRHKNGTSVWVGQRSHGCGMLVLSCFAHHLAYTWALDALVKTIPLDRRDLGVLAFENELAWAIRDEVAVDRGAWTADFSSVYHTDHLFKKPRYSPNGTLQ